MGGGGATRLRWELTHLWPYKDMLRVTAVEWCRAGGQGQMLASKVYCTRAQKRTTKDSIKTKHFAHVGMLFIYDSPCVATSLMSWSLSSHTITDLQYGGYNVSLMWDSRLYWRQTHNVISNNHNKVTNVIPDKHHKTTHLIMRQTS